MGNCIALLSGVRRLHTCYGYMQEEEEEEEGLLKIVKADGKVVVYSTSMSVRDLLSEFDGFAVGVTRQEASHLPPDHELRTGEVYFLLPLDMSGADGAKSLEDSSRCRRVKLVLTKQQLQELLLRKVDVEDVLLTLKEMEEGSTLSCSTCWKPQLETIQEECQLVNLE